MLLKISRFGILFFGLLSCACSKKTGETPSQNPTPTPTPPPPVAFNFVHPGILNTTSTLDYIRNQANDNSSARFNYYNTTVIAYINANPMPTSFPSTVEVVGSGTTPSETQMKTDAMLAYALALRWAKTADATTASQAITILNGWSSSFQQMVPGSGTQERQTHLEASWVAPTFAASAEILRHYKPGGVFSGWSSTDISKFESFLIKLKDNYIDKIVTSNGTGNDTNWGTSAGLAKMAIGVFLSDATVYTSGLNFLKAKIPNVIYAYGTMPELCDRNDCWHFQYTLSGLSFGAEIANIQGDNSVYTANSNRINSGYDYMSKAYNSQVSCIKCTGGGGVYAAIEVANRYYKNNETLALRDLGDPYGAPSSLIFLGFTTYTHFNVT